jgi:hypothetical protein
MSNDFDDLDDAPRRGRRRSESGHGGSSFWTMFGGSMGCAAAVGVLFLALTMGCCGCLMLPQFMKKDRQTTTEPAAPRERPAR